VKGPERLETRVANTRIVTEATLSDGIIHGKSQVWQALGEVAPEDVTEAKLAARKLKASVMQLTAPAEVTWRWQLDEKQLHARTAPILRAFDKAIAFALDDDFSPLIQKAEFLETIYDYPAALAVYDQLIDKAPSADNHLRRSRVLLALGRRADAIADLRAAYSIDPANGTAFSLAQELAYAGKIDEALDLLGSLPIRDADRTAYAETRATVVGLKGDSTTALSLLADAVASKPENSDVLNADCWFRGLFNVALDSAVGQCTHAIERADQPFAALDSRALVEYRLGDYDAALADLNAVLKLAPAVPASRYMRGVTRLKKGDKGGREDIETALRMSPSIAEFYARHGVSPAA
jgi:tetratricopeptide (TPR) repeat protein